ncbi:DnaB-like helicase C-terminal domain-containing protein [Streptomyces sp. NPDC018031]|uniref:DnaB-like helicase C-terminal domain-containing protein n=1 Tax=Streptomyces sp. NPDC018031 TaxID=3365033 RepID=UPI0037A4A2A6
MSVEQYNEDEDWGDPLEYLPSPWPELDPHLHLHAGHLIGIGALPGTKEARAGHSLAQHTAARGVRTVLFSPHAVPSEPSTPLLHIQRRRDLHPDAVEDVVRAFTPTQHPVGLVVIDCFQLMHANDTDGPVSTPEQAAEVGRRLKILAFNTDYHQPPIVVMSHLRTPPAGRSPLDLSYLGLAAELEYDADTLLLLHRTGPDNVDVLIAKDRHGPAPSKTSLTW